VRGKGEFEPQPQLQPQPQIAVHQAERMVDQIKRPDFLWEGHSIGAVAGFNKT
jgi:hypothetical protein